MKSRPTEEPTHIAGGQFPLTLDGIDADKATAGKSCLRPTMAPLVTFSRDPLLLFLFPWERLRLSIAIGKLFSSTCTSVLYVYKYNSVM